MDRYQLRDPSAVDSTTTKIENASGETMRAVLHALCQDHYIKSKAARWFREVESISSSKQARISNSNTGAAVIDLTSSDGEGNNSGPTNQGQQNKKRKATSEVRICTRCKEAFIGDESCPDECQYHPGEMEMNEESSTWDDWEEWRGPDPQDPDTMEEYPEGYTWTCCKESGDDPGCEFGLHSLEDR
ncbi:hypothetical protein F4777DRAFT_530608 [Nemania sp. FL0916]|nr:hypothetical protein F4777DRAFT_530608 [Nemania sp. FL0916]